MFGTAAIFAKCVWIVVLVMKLKDGSFKEFTAAAATVANTAIQVVATVP